VSARLWITIAGVLLIAAIAGGVAWQRMHAAPRPGDASFVPNRDNDKALYASWTSAELEKILADFTRLYREQLRADFAYDVRPAGAMQKATFPHDLQPWLFLYLVNYAQYPQDLNLEGRTLAVAGAATLTPDFVLPAQAMYGRKALFYVPANDDKFDVVHASAGGEHWEIGLESGEWKQVPDARIPQPVAGLLPQ
jgi:hypothetical protein